MGSIFSDRISDVPKSFIREILKVTTDKNIISFAGGLPNRKLFPVTELRQACMNVFDGDIEDALQYSTSEGDSSLREWISKRYKKKQNLDISPDDIIITTGSQQGLDLLGKVLINEKDPVIIEEPGYLGAIQSFSLYRPEFHPVPLNENGIDTDSFRMVMESRKVKLFYSVPNFQNPSGITYSQEVREKVSAIIKGSRTILIEDNPYGDLRFMGTSADSFYSLIPDNTVLLGSFSKTVVPSFRLGWMVVRGELKEKIVIAKQASDLHSNYFSQKVLSSYLFNHDLDEHIEKIREVYKSQRNAMIDSIKKYFPSSVKYTQPEGGMFLWITLPENKSAIDLFYKSIESNIAFVPGDPFYINRTNVNALRLNYSCVDEATIEKGISVLGSVIKDFIS